MPNIQKDNVLKNYYYHNFKVKKTIISQHKRKRQIF